MTDPSDLTTQTLAETSDFMIWKAEEPDGEITYHIELGNITLHFFEEEWEQFKALVSGLNP
jgi:hypothetical protein